MNDSLAEDLRAVRRTTEELCRPLAAEDFMAQPEECVSPPKWHLAHTTWFFETFLLAKYLPGYRTFDDTYAFLFNSYYEAVGERAAKAKRGAYSRPVLDEVFRYRAVVGEGLDELLASREGDSPEVRFLVELGMHHEQQHQELLLTDIKRIFHFQPSGPAYAAPGTVAGARPVGVPAARGSTAAPAAAAEKPDWISIAEGLYEIGAADDGFAFDNEKPPHRFYAVPFRIQDRLVSNGRYLDFIEDGGYRRPELWLSEGWDTRRREGWDAPLYWKKEGGAWREFTLAGWGPIDPAAPVCHVSHFEADAFARWSGARLPREGEWETAACRAERVTGTLLEDGALHPRAARGPGLTQMLGDAWEWTGSAYLPYPGYRPFPGGVGEYNGKFMSSQMVLRGASCATPRSHARLTYRNFFPAATRWQFSGIRLANNGDLG